jgi:site-specific DNA recombinase
LVILKNNFTPHAVRPEFNLCLDFIRNQKEKVALVCDKVDRLQRSILDIPKLEELRTKEKVVIHFLDIGKLDGDSNSQQKAFYRMSVVMANSYTDAISDNVKRSILHKLNNGECIQKAPLGYLNAKDTNGKSTVIIDSSRAFLIKQMFEMYSLGNTSLGDLEKFAHQNNLTNNFFKGDAKPITKEVIRNILKNPFYYGFMYVEKYKRSFKHKYETIISQDLYLQCQTITEGRAKANNRIQAVQTAKAGKDFIFKSLITCATTGRTVSCDRKENRTNKNTYLIARDPKNPNKRVFVKESDVLEEISQVFKALQFPKPMLDEITTHLKTSHQAEIEYHTQKIKELNKQKENCKAKLNKLVDMVLNNLITEEIYNTKKAEIEKEIKYAVVEIQLHEQADNNFKECLITAFYLASKSYDLFICSTTQCGIAKNEEKRRLISFVFSNIQLNGSKVSYTLRKPFDIMAKMNRNEDWLPLGTTLRTESYGDVIQYGQKLKLMKVGLRELQLVA